MKNRWLDILPGVRPWRLLLLLMAAVGLALLAGCEDKGGEEENGVEVQSAARAMDRQKVRVSLWGTELLANFSQFLCEKFPEVDFEFSLATNSTDYYRYRSERGDLPDILTVRRFSLKDALVLKDDLYDLANTDVAAGFYGSYLDSYTYGDGVVNWLPACAEVDSIIVNTTLFKEHGIAVPHDYASFIEACRAFEKKGIRGFASDFLSDFTCMETLQGFAIPNMKALEGREWRRRYESGSENSLSREVWLPAFERFFAMKRGVGLGREDTLLRNRDVKALYAEGKVAMYRGTGQDLVKFSGREGDVSILLPYFAEKEEENCYLTYPAFQVALAKRGMENPEREKLLLEILSAMLSQEGQSRIAHGRNMVAYNKNVSLELQSGLDDLKGAIAENRMYIRLASNEMFALSKNVVQRILKGELNTPEEALAAFNEQMAASSGTGQKIAAHIREAYPYAFSMEHGSQAASAIFNTVRAEAGTDLLLAQACYAGNVYAGDYTAKEVRYLTKNDYCWPMVVKLTGDQLFTVVDELLKIKGHYGTVSNESTLYVSSGFEMHLEKKDGDFILKELTMGGAPMNRQKEYSVYLLGDVDIMLPAALKKAGYGKFELVRTHSNDYIQKRLVEKSGDLEKPTGYITIR